MTASTGYREYRASVREAALTDARMDGCSCIPLLDADAEVTWAQVDPTDFEDLAGFSWSTCDGYAVRYEGDRTIGMHRHIMGDPPGMEVDHENGNRLDNRRTNLRVATGRQNRQNVRRTNAGASPYRGVALGGYGGKYIAHVRAGGVQRSGGSFTEELHAALRAQFLRREEFGEWAGDDPLLEDALRERYAYDAWPSGEPYQWEPASRGTSSYDAIDSHVDLFCGRLKKGRIGVDRFPDPGVDIVMDLNTLSLPPEYHNSPAWKPIGRLPFATSSIKSIVTHHGLEHLGDGFLPLMDEVYRVLEPGGLFRAIVPLFPSRTAVEDPDHRRYFMEGTWETFGGKPGEPHWHESFAVPYTTARFTIVDKDVTPAVPLHEQWGPSDAREIRVAMVAEK